MFVFGVLIQIEFKPMLCFKDNYGVFPIHCAATNASRKVLDLLLTEGKPKHFCYIWLQPQFGLIPDLKHVYVFIVSLTLCVIFNHQPCQHIIQHNDKHKAKCMQLISDVELQIKWFILCYTTLCSMLRLKLQGYSHPLVNRHKQLNMPPRLCEQQCSIGLIILSRFLALLLIKTIWVHQITRFMIHKCIGRQTLKHYIIKRCT